MKILIIGASGMLAGPVIRKLDEGGFGLRLFSRSVKPSMFINEYEIVQGDLYNPDDLDRAVKGCDAIHITISNTDDVTATEVILKAAKENHIQQISMVSGCTVAEENRWFGFTDKKFRAEQMIIQSGIPYYIFRPTWFFESLEMLVRNGKATILGKQPGLYHWVAGDDLGRMVAYAYATKGTENGIYYVYGPESYPMKTLLEMYCMEIHPEIRKVTEAPIPVLKLVALLTRNSQLRFAVSLFSYFQKVREPGITAEELGKLGKAEIDFKTWIEYKKTG
jgi:uncharacterized protein YbjT (DUF2867 family)